ncbi:MAG: Ig-like domain-containing protein [Verrucomicrobia bacterium]|nr:Ig-like domain-containing protein [Verrucomicrobiota bacterium]
MKLVKLAIWVFVAGISLFAAVGIFFSAASVERGGGPGAPLEGVAVAVGLQFALIAAGVFACCIIFRPKELTESPPRLVIAIVLALGIAVSLRVALYRTGLFEMRVVVVDSAGHPIPGVKVSWDGSQFGEGLGNYNSVATGSGLTSSDGSIAFSAHHPHRIDLVLAFSAESKASVMIEPSGRTYGHIVRPDERVAVRSVTPFQMHFDSIMVPNTGDVTLEIKRL